MAANHEREANEAYVGNRDVPNALPQRKTLDTVRYEADRIVHTNTIENVFSIFKRGMSGVYRHCGETQLLRNLAEFDFRYNRRAALKITDNERHDQLLAKIEVKRLTYRRIGEADNAQAKGSQAADDPSLQKGQVILGHVIAPL